MPQSSGQGSRIGFLQTSALAVFLLLVLVPVILSNQLVGAFVSIILMTLLFFFSGYLFLWLLRNPLDASGYLTAAVLGLVSITTAYDLFARASLTAYFPYFVSVLSLAGIILFAVRARRASGSGRSPDGYEIFAGAAVALSIAPLYWRSGRFSGNEFVFYGPAGQDPLFHVTLVQRLLHHVPPDNFIVAGLRPPVYHYFGDLAQALVLHTQAALQLATGNVFDLYYRCYPTVLYFLLGALAYRVGKQLTGTKRGGVLGIVLLLGGGGLGWVFGALQTLIHAGNLAAMRGALFSEWTNWDGINSILPLVHRPAHYNGLLISLAALTLLLRPERSRRDWITAGLLLGLMAGFNFTLAGIFGVAAVFGTVLLWARRRREEARDLAWLALFQFLGSLPVTAAMVLSGFHNPAPRFPFRGPNLELSTQIWGGPLSRILPAALVPWAGLIVFPIIAYGLKLLGLPAMARINLGHERHRAIAVIMALVFALSFVIGMFFPYNAFGGVGIIFIQPTLWIVGLFALAPLNRWLQRGSTKWRALFIWGILGLTWGQTLTAFNLSHRAVFHRETVSILIEIRRAASSDDVVAYLPSELRQWPIWGEGGYSTNFAVMAMTGLDGYFGTEAYSTSFAVPALKGRNADDILEQAERLYRRRQEDLSSCLAGGIKHAGCTQLVKDHVRWIVLSGDLLGHVSPAWVPWRTTDQMTVYRLPE